VAGRDRHLRPLDGDRLERLELVVGSAQLDGESEFGRDFHRCADLVDIEMGA
jgi:hypothetical protein